MEITKNISGKNLYSKMSLIASAYSAKWNNIFTGYVFGDVFSVAFGDVFVWSQL